MLSKPDFSNWDFPVLEGEAETVPPYVLEELRPEPEPEPVLPETPAIEPARLEVPVVIEPPAAPVFIANLDEERACLKAICQEIHHLSEVWNQEILQDLILMVQHAVEKIVLRSFDTQADWIAEMIQQTLQRFPKPEERIQLEVCKDMGEYFKDHPLDFDLEIKIDKKLQKGDFRIHTPRSKIEAIVQERLATLFEKLK